MVYCDILQNCVSWAEDAGLHPRWGLKVAESSSYIVSKRFPGNR